MKTTTLTNLYTRFFNLHKEEIKETDKMKTKYIKVLNRICKLANTLGYEVNKNFYFMTDRREKAKFDLTPICK